MRSRQPSNDRLPATLRVTVIEAASILGITPDAVRSRLRRGTLHKETSEDGTVYVRLNTEGLAGLNDQTTDRSADQTTVAYINELKSEIDYLKETVAKRDEEIRRRDHLLAAALERIPHQLKAPPSEARESPESAENASDSNTPRSVTEGPQEPTARPQEEEQRSWWRRPFE
jgi:predicted ArsR family transcriptional regulator